MKISLQPVFAALVLSTAGISMVNSAHAGCGFEPPALKPNAWNPVTQTPALQPAVYHLGSDEGRFVLTGDDWDRHDEPAIVGMWRFELLGPNAFLVDDCYAQFHSDGTEIQNSGVHAPRPAISASVFGKRSDIGPISSLTFRLAGTPPGRHLPLRFS